MPPAVLHVCFYSESPAGESTSNTAVAHALAQGVSTRVIKAAQQGRQLYHCGAIDGQILSSAMLGPPAACSAVVHAPPQVGTSSFHRGAGPQCHGVEQLPAGGLTPAVRHHGLQCLHSMHNTELPASSMLQRTARCPCVQAWMLLLAPHGTSTRQLMAFREALGRVTCVMRRKDLVFWCRGTLYESVRSRMAER